MMNKITIFLAVFLCSLSVFAQNKSDQIRSLKIAHLSSVLNLSTTEAEKFWPIYNTYDQKIHELRHNDIVRYIKHSDLSELEALSEAQASVKVQELIDFDESYFTLRKNFIKDAQKILSNKKILILKKAEDDFNRKLLKKYREKK
ncbi:hypothetical protein ACYSNV_04140 [Myroides sp. LJL119]